MKSKKFIKNFASAAISSAVFLAAIPAAQAQVAPTERQALIDFYESTNGLNWTNKTGWLGEAGTECTWYGVTCSLEDSVSPNPNKTVIVLGLSNNNLQGQISGSLKNLKNLKFFDVNQNQLAGNLPSLSELTNLQVFLVNKNQLAGGIPLLSGLKNLQIFHVFDNQLTGSIPSLSGLTNLNQFIAYNNQLTGNIPSLSGLTNLQYFIVDKNQLAGSVPSLSELTNLQGFAASGNRLTGNIPSLSGLTNLQYFIVSENQLAGSVPSLSGLTNLQQVLVHNNQLTGNVPSLSGLTNLKQFIAHNNQLTGNILSISELTNLQDFVVSENQLTGGVPSLSGLTNLQQVLVENNQLTGNLPSLSGLINLQFFGAGNNQLTGNIPSLSGLTNLKIFNVGNNQLTGNMPSLSGLSNLVYFSIEHNKISGSLTEPPPASLFAASTDGQQHWARLCQNQLVSAGNTQIDSQWDRINYYDTQNTPWQTCQTLPPPPVVIPTASITPNPPEGGTGSCNAIGGNNIFECTATPTPGYTFSGFSGACVGPTCIVSTTEGNKNVTANFNKIAFNITTHPTPSYGGTLVCESTLVDYNGSTHCVATPKEGYEIGSYSGACIGTPSTLNLCSINNVQSDQQASVTFINRDQGVYLSFDGYCDVIRFDRVPGSEAFYGRNIPDSCDGDALMFARIVQTNNNIFVTVVGGYVQDGSGQSSALKLLDLKLDQTRTNLTGNFTAKAVMRGANEQATQVTGSLSGTWSLNTTKGSGTYAAQAAYGSTAANQMRAKAVSKPSLFKQIAP